MRIPFDNKFRPQIESGEFKVETRDGRKVRIICWDRKCNDYPYPIIALLEKESGEEDIISYTQNGQHVIGILNLPTDLFIVTPEPELTPFEKKLIQFSDERNSMECDNLPEDREEEILANHLHRKAAELLSLAREQLQPEIDAEIEKAYKTADDVQYRKGREEALRDMPRWKKCPLYFEHGEIGKTNKDDDILSYQGYSILLSDLAKLPKENSHE